jgi:hypothetical protein
MESGSIFLVHLGDSPRMRLMQFLIEGRDFDYTLTDMLNANISWGTLNTIVPKLVKVGIVIPVRKIGRATLYKINKDNKVAMQLMKIYDYLILEELERREIGIEVVVD